MLRATVSPGVDELRLNDSNRGFFFLRNCPAALALERARAALSSLRASELGSRRAAPRPEPAHRSNARPRPVMRVAERLRTAADACG